MMCDLMGQVAWVTGAGFGIGQAAAVTLAKARGGRFSSALQTSSARQARKP